MAEKGVVPDHPAAIKHRGWVPDETIAKVDAQEGVGAGKHLDGAANVERKQQVAGRQRACERRRKDADAGERDKPASKTTNATSTRFIHFILIPPVGASRIVEW